MALTKEQKAAMKSIDDAKSEVAHINQRFGPWAYELPEYKAKDFRFTQNGKYLYITQLVPPKPGKKILLKSLQHFCYAL